MGVYANINGSLLPITGMPSDMVGATASTPGEHGLAPAPLVADRNDFLRGDGTWGDNNFIGTMNEWDTLSVDNKTKYKTADITSGVVPPTPPPPTPTATYTITYYANGGSGTMMADVKIEDMSYAIRDNKFTAPSGKIFLEWNTSVDGSGITYNADDLYTVNADLTLYAIWKLVALKFSSDDAFTLSAPSSNWDGTLQYSTDNGTSWSTWDGSQLSGTKTQPIYIRGIGNSVISGQGQDQSTGWSFTGKYCTGNIETLLDYEKVANNESITMSDSCYSTLFAYCQSLVTAPELPSTNLTYRCYAEMFSGCIALTTAPQLPATILADSCYLSMFKNCQALTTIPELPATTLAPACYYSMFEGCTSLINLTQLIATTLESACYYMMFRGCTSLTILPKLPATTLSSSCYYWMFNGCSNIKLSTSKTGTYQYEYRIPTSGTGITATNALNSMFTNTGGTFTGTPSLNTIYYTDHAPV